MFKTTIETPCITEHLAARSLISARAVEVFRLKLLSHLQLFFEGEVEGTESENLLFRSVVDLCTKFESYRNNQLLDGEQPITVMQVSLGVNTNPIAEVSNVVTSTSRPTTPTHATPTQTLPATPPQPVERVGFCPKCCELSRENEILKKQLALATGTSSTGARANQSKRKLPNTTPPPPSSAPTGTKKEGVVPSTAVVGSSSTGSRRDSTSSGYHRALGSVRATQAKLLSNAKELRQKLNAIKTGIKAFQFSVVLQQFSSLVIPQCQNLVASNRKMLERNYTLEQLAIETHCRVGTLPDEGSAEGYLPDSVPLHAGPFFMLDDRRFNDWCGKIKIAVQDKVSQVQQFTTRLNTKEPEGALGAAEKHQREVSALEEKLRSLEAIAVDWECVATAVVSETLFDTLSAQTTRKVSLAGSEKLVMDANEEIRAVSNTHNWISKTKVRTKLNNLRKKRTEALQQVESVIAQELHQFSHSGAQRSVSRGKISVLREMIGLTSQVQLVEESKTGSDGTAGTAGSVHKRSDSLTGVGNGSTSLQQSDLTVSGSSARSYFNDGTGNGGMAPTTRYGPQHSRQPGRVPSSSKLPPVFPNHTVD